MGTVYHGEKVRSKYGAKQSLEKAPTNTYRTKPENLTNEPYTTLSLPTLGTVQHDGKMDSVTIDIYLIKT